MTTIEIKGRTFQVPTTWNELSFKQLVKVVEIVYGDYPVTMGKLLLFKTIAGFTDLQWAFVTPDEVDDLLYLVDFIGSDTKLTRQLVPRQGRFTGPADSFNNLVMHEFVFTEDHFFRFKDGESIEHLNNLVAVLFRPVKKGYDTTKNLDGDARIPFNENLCLYNAKRKIAKWDINIKLAILTWYEACRIQMVEDFPEVFKDDGTGDPAKYGLLSMMRNVAAGGVHGNFSAVEGMYVKMALIELDEMLTESRQIEKLKPKNT